MTLSLSRVIRQRIMSDGEVSVVLQTIVTLKMYNGLFALDMKNACNAVVFRKYRIKVTLC